MRRSALALVAVSLLAACTGDGGGLLGKDNGDFGAVSARLSTGVATVVIVDWTAFDGADEQWVEYGTSTGYGHQAPLRLGHDDEALILGVKPGTKLHYRVGARVGDAVAYSADGTITTGELDLTLPTYDVSDDAPDEPWGQFVLTSSFNTGSGQTSVLLFNREGDAVWGFAVADGFIPAARPSRDGTAIVYLTYADVTDSENAQICRFDLGGEGQTCVATPYAHHDFVELADGSYTYTQEVAQRWETYDLVGDALVNLDTAGNTTQLWSSFDEITPVPTSQWSQHQLSRGIDWTHANGMWHDEDSGDYYVSFYYFEEVRKIDGASLTTDWVLGGDENDFAFDGPTFGPQHAPQRSGDSLYVFDNSTNGAGGSRIASYTLDEAALTATADVNWRHPDARHTNVLGDNHLLPNGYIATGWGDEGEMMIYSPEGDILWRYTPQPGVSSCQVYAFDDPYTMSPD